jgi:hypothetical protein
MNDDSQNFEANFMKDVKAASVLEVKPKTSFSPKIKIIIAGLMLVIAILAVLLVAKNESNTRSVVGAWKCEDDATLVFMRGDDMEWINRIGRFGYKYEETGGGFEVVTPGGRITGDTKGYNMYLTDTNGVAVGVLGGQQSCERVR